MHDNEVLNIVKKIMKAIYTHSCSRTGKLNETEDGGDAT